MELGWMGGWMGGFCQGFKAMTSLKCDWSDAVTVGEPSRMMSVLSIFSLQSVEQTVEEWGGGAKLTGNSFTQQQVCVLQSCTKRKKQRASSSSSYFSHLCSQQQMLCVGVSVCVRMCVWLCLCVVVCVCLCGSECWCVCFVIFFFSSWLWFKLLAQLPHLFLLKASSAVLISFPPVLFPPFFPYSFPFLPALHCLLDFFFYTFFILFFTFPSFHLSPPAILFSSSPPLHLSLILILCLILWPFLLSFPHFPLPLLSILSYFPSFLPPSSFPSTSATAADWDWSGALHCGKLEVGGCGKLSR